MQKTLGGDRLGSGNKMKVNLHNFERSTHDLSYIWRSTMSAGTLVPFMSEIALPGDTWDIDLRCEIMTHPTIGPLFGTYKVQLDIFQAPLRLYHGLLHNNALGIGLNMSQIKLPIYTLNAPPKVDLPQDADNAQTNPSSILAYLGIRGAGVNKAATISSRHFNAIPILAYWEIYKNYYANKSEEIGSVIHTDQNAPSTGTITGITTTPVGGTAKNLPPSPANSNNVLNNQGDIITVSYTGQAPIPSQIIINTLEKGDMQATDLFYGWHSPITSSPTTATYNAQRWGQLTLRNWRASTPTDLKQGKPGIRTFPLENIDKMRNEILAYSVPGVAFYINQFAGTTPLYPYDYLWHNPAAAATVVPNIMFSQEGLGLKTYQSDLYQNWLNSEWIDGNAGVNQVTAIDTSGGSFTIDTLNLSKKVYDMLNRIAVSGGSYDDWLDAVYAHDRYQRCESPMYMGGLIKELAFQEVVSNAQSSEQSLGTLAGKGVMTNKHKGGHIVIKVDEPSYIMGIISLTPRIDYSQGNKWDMNLKSLDDLHKPSLDEIGFQELMVDQLAWWSTIYNTSTSEWDYISAGKQPAWLNYMTNINRTFGNFAIAANEMFMTLNRRYQYSTTVIGPKDMTTYIDPSQFNNIFAETALDAQNFWSQISIDIKSRRKISAKLMPNL